MKKLFLISLNSIAIFFATAQSIADGVKALYYEKYKTATDIFQKLVNADPSNADANYWLGVAYLKQDDLKNARDVFSKAMATTKQNPLIIAGMGHVELLEGKPTDAKAHFEAALSLTNNKRGGDPKILTAVGFANADGGSKVGDRLYGIEKLDLASKLDTKNPEIMIYMGLCQLKRGGEYGGEAKKAFEEALVRDPQYARAKVRIAKIFMSQNNKELFLPLLEEATQMDPNYGPAWLALYSYYSRRDVNKAKEYLDHYIAVAEKDCETDFFYADYLLQANKKAESLEKAKEIEKSCNGNTFPKVYKLYAIIYDRMGDSVNAKTNMGNYLAKENPTKVDANDYASYASILAKFPGNETEAEKNMEMAISKDTALSSKIDYINQMAALLAKAKIYQRQLKWMDRLAELKSNLSATDLYYWGDAATKAGDFTKADQIYTQYIQKYPDQSQGYSLKAKAAKLADADTSKGIAIPAIEEHTSFLMKDTAKNKNLIINNYGYEIFYYVKAKDFDKVKSAAEAILSLDPVNAYGKQALDIANKMLRVKGTPKTPTTPTKSNVPPKPPVPPKGKQIAKMKKQEKDIAK